MTVPPTHASASAVRHTADEQLVPGTYFVDEVDGTPTPRIFVTIGTGWTNFDDGTGLGKRRARWHDVLTSTEDDIGFITFSRPDRVYLDACHLDDGFHPGPVTTLDGLVAALSEQRRMGRRDRPVGHLRRRLPRQDVPTHGARRALGLPQHVAWAHESSRG